MITASFANYKEAKISLFQHIRIFAKLTEDALREVSSMASESHFPKGAFIFHEGDEANFFQVVKSGRVELSKLSLYGKKLIIHISQCGDTINCCPIFNGGCHWVSARALDEVSVMNIRVPEFLSFLSRHPTVWMEIIQEISMTLESTFQRLEDMATKSVEQRLCSVLCSLSAKFGVTLSFTGEEIAAFVGTTRETTHRLMGNFKNQGILCYTRGKITILDQTKLQRLANGS